MPEFHAPDVLDKYIATLNAPRKSIIRDASELPYPKDVIKVVVRGCIAMLKPDDKEKEQLKIAYLALADYQFLTDEERKAVAIVADVGEPGDVGSELLRKQAHLIGSVSDQYQAVLNRSRIERDGLSLELKTL